MPIGKVHRYTVSVTVGFVCAFVRLRISAEDKASDVKFCTVVHRRPGQGISHFGELCSPEAENRTNRRAASRIGMCR